VISTRRGSAAPTRTATACCQYFPKGTDFSTVSEAALDAVAHELNDRPRKRLGFYKPSEKITDLLSR
jgi:IS30 family transposase